MANKLHELLAVEQDRKHKANQALGEAKNIFTKKDPYFDGMVKRYVSLEENAEQIPDEQKTMVLTVADKLSQTLETVTKGVDAHLSKEETNASGIAKAVLVIDGQNFGTFSATSLLAMESHLSKIRDLYNSIPVLDPAKKWTFDEQAGIYKSEDVKFRSVKRPKVIVKYEATEKHPAQTELLYLDFQVGKYETTYTSGKITPAKKAELLGRIDRLTEGVKIARSKANDVEVKNIKIGQRLFDFIQKDIL
jgi:hypothetical protein